jgi:hypothetical protein
MAAMIISPSEKIRAALYPPAIETGLPPTDRMTVVTTTLAVLTPLAASICWAVVSKPAASPWRSDSTSVVPAMFNDIMAETRPRAEDTSKANYLFPKLPFQFYKIFMIIYPKKSEK